MERSKREQIIEQAFGVFYRDGFHASGMESLLEGSGISKRTLYRYFESKEALIEATVRHYTDRLMLAWDEQRTTGLKKVMLPIDWLKKATSEGRHGGCFALNAKLEYSGRHAAIEAACSNFFVRVERFIGVGLVEHGAKNPRVRARQIAILFRGAIVTRQTEPTSACIQSAKAAIRELVG